MDGSDALLERLRRRAAVEGDDAPKELARILADDAARVRDRDLADLREGWRKHRARAAAEGVPVAVLPGTDELLERTGAFAAEYSGPLPAPVAEGVAECGTRMRKLGGRLDREGTWIEEAVRVHGDALAKIERSWRLHRARAAMQNRDIAFLPETDALLEQTREFAEEHPGALPEATAGLAKECESMQCRWKRLSAVAVELEDFDRTRQPPDRAVRKTMAEAEGLLGDSRLAARALDEADLASLRTVLARLADRHSAEEPIRELRKGRDALEREAEREGCHPFHVPGYAGFMERLESCGHDLPPDLAGMVGERPELEARDRGIRHRVREVTDFVARRRRIIKRAARWQPDTPLKRSGVGGYARWARAAPKVIERGERLARDALLSPEDRKALENALARIRAAPESDGLDARRLRTWEEICDRADEQGCHRYFVDGYYGFVRKLERSPCVSRENKRFGVRERTVLHKMMGEEAWLKSTDKNLARIIKEREDGGERFVSEVHPYAWWKREAERHVKDAGRMLGDPETYDRHLSRMLGLEERLREAVATVEEAIRRDAPERKAVVAAHERQAERDRERKRELSRSRDRSASRSMGIEMER